MSRRYLRFAMMGCLIFTLFALLSFVAIPASPQQSPRSPEATAMGTAFTYQGQLKKNAAGISGTCDFEMKLYDALTSGTQVGTTQTLTGVGVSNGLFSAPLDFGTGAFTGEARWLQIGVRCPTLSGGYTTLDPRQALNPVPYALALPGLRTIPHGDSINVIGGYPGNEIIPIAYGLNLPKGATIGGGGESGSTNRVSGDFGTVGGGKGNFAGTYGTDASKVATIGGGEGNAAGGNYSTVGGGNANASDGSGSTIGGGYSNHADGSFATIGGGNGNITGHNCATIAGGYQNSASAYHTTVPGGYSAAATHMGEMAYASGSFAARGDAQTSTYVLRNQTSDATPTELFLDLAGERLILASNRTVNFEIQIVARSDTNGAAGWRVVGAIERSSTSTAFVGTPTVGLLGKEIADWNVEIAVDDVNEALIILVTGKAGSNIRWVAVVRTVEVSW